MNNLLYPFVPAAREMHARSCKHTLPIGLINDAINLIIELQTSAPGDDDVARPRYNCPVEHNGAAVGVQLMRFVTENKAAEETEVAA